MKTMTARRRHEYRLDLRNLSERVRPTRIPGARVRADLAINRYTLSKLMLNAYRGTIDYDGETIDEARAEIDRYLDDQELTPLLNRSWLFYADGHLVSACLVSWWPRRQCPIVAYVLTDPEWKHRGIAAELLQEVIHSLGLQDFRELRAVITEGNIPSERLFARAGFRRIEHNTAAQHLDNLPKVSGKVATS